MGDTLKTVMSSYVAVETTVGTATESIPATTGFVVAQGGISGGYDLWKLDPVEDASNVNMLSIIVSATASNGNTGTIAFFGAVDGGPPEYICTVDYIFGTATRSSGVLWADTATVTSYHTTTIQQGGAVDNDIKRLNFDFTGFRFIKAYVTARSGATAFNVWARYF
jgi:hypothetical protein